MAQARKVIGSVRSLALLLVASAFVACSQPTVNDRSVAPAPVVSGSTATAAPLSASEQAAPGENSAESGSAATELQNSDCQKCHDTQPAEVAEAGGKHQTSVTCLECHIEHLPLGTQTVPECGMCHGGGGHYELENCLGCHANPHTPLRLNIADSPETSAGCLTCHEDKGTELEKNPSKHSEQNCTLCHPKQHKAINKCQECHSPHADFMTYEDCLQCHKPHSPLDITYSSDVDSRLCGSCHDEILAMLAANTTKHHDLSCAYCHQDRHPTVPKCQDCHESPHSADLLTQFPDCLKCHGNPHNLVK